MLDYTTKDNKIKETITQYQETNDGHVSRLQTDVSTALGKIATKISQTDYDKKTGELSSHINDVKDTADKSLKTIADIQKADGKQDDRMEEIERTAEGIKSTVSDLSTAQDKQSGYISTLQQRADGFKATVTKVNNLSIGGRNLLLGTEQFTGGWERWNWDNTWDADPYNGHKAVQTRTIWGGPEYRIDDLINRKVVEPNTDYTLSVKIKNTSNSPIDIYFFAPNIGITDRHIIKLPQNSDWTTISTTFQFPDTNPNGNHWTMRFEPSSDIPSWQGTIIQTEMKFERGNIVTDWTPAPEDVDSTIAKVKLTADEASTAVSKLTSADGIITKAQADIKANANAITEKVSKTDYNQKTGELLHNVNEAKDTADKAVRTIGDYKTSNDKRIKEAESSIERTANSITEKVSQTDYNKKTGELSGDISKLQQTAKGFEATVTKVDNLSVGGRNLYLNSRVLANSYGGNGNVKVTVEPFDSATNMWHFVAAQGQGNYVGAYIWGYGKLPDNSDWSYSADIKGTGKVVQFGIELGDKNPVKGNIGSKWSRISQTGHVKEPVNKTIIMYFDTRDSPLDVYIKLPKLETGNIATDWTPAPEDVETALAQVKITADGVSSIVSDPTRGLSVRVQTAEGTLNTVKSTADGAMSKASQTANDIKQEISDRKTGDSNTLQSSKDFTQISITSAVKGVNSTITQTSGSLIAKINTKTDSDTVLSLLKDNWSIGINDNISKITSGIVGNASQMSLISKNVTIDSPNTQIKGTAWINSAMIQNGSIVNANIADAAITSAKIAQLDVAKLTGDTTSFIKSNWSSAYGNVSITPTNITLQSYTGDTLMSEFSVGDLGMTVKMPGISSFLDSTIINANGMSFQHSGGSYATVGVMDAGFTVERNPSGGAPMSIKIGDGVHNIANNMVFAITAAQNNGTSPQLIWAGADVGKITTAYRTWDNPQGFILADNIKFSTWDNTASKVEIDDTVNFYNYAPVQVYGQRFSDGTTRSLHLGGKEYGAKWFGFLSGGDQAGFGTDNSGDVQFFMKGKRYSLYAMLDRLHMR